MFAVVTETRRYPETQWVLVLVLEYGPQFYLKKKNNKYHFFYQF
jgi:hypothetical protein